ncbi:MAG: 2-oxoacid:acceptor oxidoreductase family protein [Mogibacterium sp.]|nr:2-oxoacid:acceptor oxidoreductase family protein [Mogibacterium sp.]
MREIVFAGFGGQGILTAGLIISQIALYSGNNATWMPAYGAAMRGGTANCTVHYGEGKVSNPGQQKPDLLLAMNEPSYKKFQGIVRPGGIILYNSDMIGELPPTKEGVTAVGVPCNTLADEVGNPKGANIAMVGAICKLLGDFEYQAGIDGMNDMFRKKGKNKYEALNVKAFEAGYNYVG